MCKPARAARFRTRSSHTDFLTTTSKRSSRLSAVVAGCTSKVILLTGHWSAHCDGQQRAPVDEDGQHQHQLADPDYIKRELKDVVAMKIDKDKNGKVSYEELKKYLGELHEKTIDHTVDKQWNLYSPQIHEVFSWEGYEPEKKEVLTWDHYFNQTYPELVGVDVGVPVIREQETANLLNPTEAPKLEETKKEDNEDEDPNLKALKIMVKRADARWKLADENGDTLLTKNEFKSLLYPDEGHDELKNLFVKEATEDMDVNKDGKICMEEFMNHVKLLSSEEERNDKNWLMMQSENFGRFLDKNKDGVLDGDEIRNWLIPAKSKKFEAEAKRLLDIGDDNQDHEISNVELVEHYEHFLSLLPPEYWHNQAQDEEHSHHMGDDGSDNGDDGPHDEL